MFKLIFASNNDHKAAEIQSAIANIISIITLKQAGININIAEPYNTLEANASEKSNVIFSLTGKNCFSEDTGLEVNALNGEPGVMSARYSERDRLFNNNIEKLLHKLKNIINRTARFKTVISLKLNNGEFLFEGICEGSIGYHPKGTNGFGYDSVFIPLGTNKTFGEMTLEEKGFFSHRKKAIDKMVVFLQQIVTTDRQSL
jgi:XTP/dITP diphosphohydrolase